MRWARPVPLESAACASAARASRGIHPEYETPRALASDIRILSKYTKRLRVYQSSESPQIPRLARFYGMDVMGGAWLDKRIEHNERELAALVELSRKYDNIDRAIVGNETVLLGILSTPQLIGYLDRARAHLRIPVSTAEPLDTWQRHPELIRHVDFVTVHILPYWEFIPLKDAIGWVLGQYKAVRKLVDYSLHFYAAKDYLAANGTPTNAAELTRHTLVTYVQDLVFADQLTFMPELYGPGYSRLECASAVGQLEAVRGGVGIGILHDYAAHRDPQLQMVLPEIAFERSYWIITHVDLRRLSRVRAISDFIIEEVGAHRAIFRS